MSANFIGNLWIFVVSSILTFGIVKLINRGRFTCVFGMHLWEGHVETWKGGRYFRKCRYCGKEKG